MKIRKFTNILLLSFFGVGLLSLIGCTNTSNTKTDINYGTCNELNKLTGVSVKLVNPSVLYVGDTMPLTFMFSNGLTKSLNIDYEICVPSIFLSKSDTQECKDGTINLEAADYDSVANYYYPYETEEDLIEVNIPDNINVQSLTYILKYKYLLSTSANITVCLGKPDENARITPDKRLCSPSSYNPKICQEGAPIKIDVSVNPRLKYAKLRLDFETQTGINIIPEKLEKENFENIDQNLSKIQKIPISISIIDPTSGTLTEICKGNITIYPSGEISPYTCIINYDKANINALLGSIVILNVKIGPYGVYSVKKGDIPIR